METSFSAWIIQSNVFLRDKDWAQVVKTNHYLPHHYLILGESSKREACERTSQDNQRSRQGFRAISRKPKPFDETGLRGGRQSSHQSRSLGALAEPFGYRTIGLARKIPHRKEGTNLALPGFFRRRRAQTIGIR